MAQVGSQVSLVVEGWRGIIESDCPSVASEFLRDRNRARTASIPISCLRN